MAILLSRAKPPYKTDEGEPGLWREGEIVAAVEDGHVFGAQEVPAAGNFHHITVTDKTLAEVQAYLDSWKHNPTTVQISATGDDRVIEVTSTMVSASGNGAFTAEPIDDLMAELVIEYPGCNALRTALTNSSFQFSITAPIGARDEIINRVNEVVRDMQHRRRRWYITQAGRDYLNANGGTVSGPASAVATYLRDGLLD